MDHQWKVARTEESFYEKVNRSVRKLLQHGQQGQEQEQEQVSLSQQEYQQQFFRNQTPPQHGQRQNTGQPQHDLNVMDIDRNQAWRLPMKCFKCNGLGHMAKECWRNSDIRGMMYKEMAEHFEALWRKKIFPLQPSEDTPTEVEEQVWRTSDWWH